MSGDNCTELPKGFLPTTEEYFKSVGTWYIVGLSLCLLMTAGTVISYIESVWFLMRNLHNWKPKDKAIWLLGLYPVLCTTAFAGLMIPRSSTLNDMVASLYLSLCVYLFVVMLMGHFGGQHKMSKRLASNQMNLRSPPMCCCCLCLPSISVSTLRLRVLEFGVLQFAILRPILAYLAAVMWTNDKYISEDLEKDSSYTWINVTNIISTLLALYSFSIVYQLSRAPLQKMAVRPKFLVLQIVMILSTFQHVIIGIFVVSGVVPCDGMLTAKANGDRWHHMLFIWEIFSISWMARRYYRKHVGDIPAEEQIIADTVDAGSMTTDTLQRQLTESQKYGAFTPQPLRITSNSQDVPSVSNTVSTGTEGLDNNATDFTDISRIPTNPSGSGSLTTSSSGNEMENFLESIVAKEAKKHKRTPVSSMFISEDGETQSAVKSDVSLPQNTDAVSENNIVLQMPNETHTSQSQT